MMSDTSVILGCSHNNIKCRMKEYKFQNMFSDSDITGAELDRVTS